MNTKREPLLSDERIVTNSHGDWSELFANDGDTSIDWADGFKLGHRKGQRVARVIYEAARAKDAELIQRLVDALAEQVQPSLDERFRGEVWYRHMAIIKDAEAAGFTPSE